MEQNLCNSVKILEQVLNVIPDIVKVYSSDLKILFCNKAGYDFYNKKPKEVVGRQCYELMSKNKRCHNCICEDAIKSKKTIETEKYVPELEKYMDLCCTPVLNENNEILYIVERLRDITEDKLYNMFLKESEETYHQIVDISPDAILILVKNKIVLANDAALKLINVKNNYIKHDISDYITDYSKVALHKKLNNIVKFKKQNVVLDCERNIRNKNISLHISLSYIDYNNNPAILMMIRDITEIKKGINQAFKHQTNSLIKQFPIPDKAFMEIVYCPAKDISGDFYKLYKLNDYYVIGILIDVSGKGVTAALSISAFEALFYEEILQGNNEPKEIIKRINKRLFNCFGEKYIAACCFSIDFNKKKCNIVGAGMNQLIYIKKNNIAQGYEIEGSFLGMFENSEFNELTINFEGGDRFYFFTDGLDFLMDDDKVIQQYMQKININSFKNYINEYLNDTITEKGKLNDDCTLLAIEIK